jgi:hypothetical protein
MGESHTAIPLDELFSGGDGSDPVKIFRSLFLPATQAAKHAYYRTGQTLDRLKIIEAIRLYAALHDGQLPKTLDDIKEVPVPKIDPVSGQPYQYRVEGNTALLDYVSSGAARRELFLNDK